MSYVKIFRKPFITSALAPLFFQGTSLERLFNTAALKPSVSPTKAVRLISAKSLNMSKLMMQEELTAG